MVCDPPVSLRKHKTLPFGYQWFYQAPVETAGAGCLVKTTLRASLHRDSSDRCLTITIATKQGCLSLVSVYLKPETLDGIESLEHTIFQLQHDNQNFVVGGDLNGHSSLWSPAFSNHAGERLEDLIHERNLHVLNNPDSVPTFYRGENTEQWLDVTLLSAALLHKPWRWTVLPSILAHSDHTLIAWTLEASPIRCSLPLTWDWNNTDWPAFQRLLQQLLPPAFDFHPPTSPNEVEQKANQLTTTFHQVMTQYTPKKRPSAYSKPWFDLEAKAVYRKLRACPRASPEFASLKQEWKILVRNKKLQNSKH